MTNLATAANLAKYNELDMEIESFYAFEVGTVYYSGCVAYRCTKRTDKSVWLSEQRKRHESINGEWTCVETVWTIPTRYKLDTMDYGKTLGSMSVGWKAYNWTSETAGKWSIAAHSMLPEIHPDSQVADKAAYIAHHVVQ